jgi:DNA polymerase-3 subunit delta'
MTTPMGVQRILGQPKATETLTAGLRSGRLHHAWIFSGPKGVGKFTTAVELAKVLLDPRADADHEPDPVGETVRRMEQNTHPDFHVIRKELALYSDDTVLQKRKLMNIPVGVLREQLIGGEVGEKFHEARAYKTPVLGHAKVFIIDEAELIDPTGQNALLKTLEEPPKRTYIFLITSRPQRLLPTIRSRCQHVQFFPLDTEAMDAWFERSGLELSEQERRWIERFCQGSPGLAQLAARYGFHQWQATLDPMLQELELRRFPAEMGQTLAQLVEDFAVAWVKGKDHPNASKDAANKDGAGHVLAILAGHARRRLIDRAGQARDPEPWPEVIDLISDAERQLSRNVNLKLVLENLVVQWARAGTTSPMVSGPS